MASGVNGCRTSRPGGGGGRARKRRTARTYRRRRCPVPFFDPRRAHSLRLLLLLAQSPRVRRLFMAGRRATPLRFPAVANNARRLCRPIKRSAPHHRRARWLPTNRIRSNIAIIGSGSPQLSSPAPNASACAINSTATQLLRFRVATASTAHSATRPPIILQRNSRLQVGSSVRAAY